MEGILAHPKTKQEAKLITEIFDKMNISYETASLSHKNKDKAAIPTVNIPNAITRRAINEARNGKGKKFTSLAGLFDELKK